MCEEFAVLKLQACPPFFRQSPQEGAHYVALILGKCLKCLKTMFCLPCLLWNYISVKRQQIICCHLCKWNSTAKCTKEPSCRRARLCLAVANLCSCSRLCCRSWLLLACVKLTFESLWRGEAQRKKASDGPSYFQSNHTFKPRWMVFLRFFGCMVYLVCFYERFGPCTTTVRSWSALQDVSPSGCWTLPGLPSVIDYGHHFLWTGIAKCWYTPSFICGYKLWGSDQKNEFVDTSCENELPVEAGFLLRAEVRS